MRYVENKIETEFVDALADWSRRNHVEVETIKLNLQGRRGWPDRIIIWEGGNLFFIEFKKPGEPPRALQEYIHKILRRMGFVVEVHDNVTDALESVKAKIRASSIAGKSDAPRCPKCWIPTISEAGAWKDGSSPESVRHTEEKGHD